MGKSFAFVLAVLCVARGADLHFKADYGRIEVGASARLQWDAQAEDKLVILGFGPVPSSGSIAVSPRRQTNYTLIDETPHGFVARTVEVEVLGSRGTDFPPDPDLFRYPVSEQRTVRSRADFLAAVFAVLQNDLNFIVRTSSLNPADVQYLTNLSERTDLVDSIDGNRLRGRRMAYLVDVQDQPAGIYCTVKAFIQFRLRAEDTWRPEGREDLYQRKDRELLNRLKALP
jgi:hypothetical protein